MKHKSWSRLFLFFCLILIAVSCSFVQGDEQPSAPPAEQKATFTVTGRVFDDANSDGKLDAGEKGIAGVRVSDGFQIVRTGRDGSYTIQGINRDSNKFVSVVTPSGRRTTDGCYRRLPKDGATCEENFALRHSPESADQRFTFAQITDIHVQGGDHPMAEEMAEIAGFKPAFVIATGDLVNDGSKMDQLRTYKSGVKESPVPIVSVPGNHDVGGGNGSPENYEELLGPTYFSFDYGGCHFITLNSCNSGDVQQKWLANDLQQAGRVPILVFQHYHPGRELMEMLARYDTKGVFTGHWHTTKTFPFESATDPKRSILYVNSPPLRFGGIDTSARGFVLGYMDRGKLRLEHRFGGVKKHLATAAPADGAEVPAGALDIRAAAYDSGSPFVRVDYRLDEGSWRAMTQSGLFGWSAQERPGPGAHTLTVRAAFADGEPVEKQVRFTVTSSAPVAPKSGDDWPMFHHDAARTGVSADSVKPPLQLAWSRPLGGSSHAAGPVIVGDRVYVGIADEDCGGKAGVYALNARNGAVIWHYPTKGSVRNAVAVADGTVYALSVDGEIASLDAATGKPRFRRFMDGVSHWFFSSPVVSNGVLYVGSGAELLALDARTGQRIWGTAEMGSDWISCLTSPAVGTDSVLMGTNWSNGLFALKKSTGKIRWNAKKGFGTSHCTPAIVGNRVYHAADSKLHALDAATGEEFWSFPLPGGWTLSSPAVSQGVSGTQFPKHRVVVGGPNGKVYCVDAETGKEVWSTSTGTEILFFQPYSGDGNPLISSPAISDSVTYCGSGDGRLYAFDMNDGKVLWSYDLGVPITSSPAVSGNAVYVTTYDGAVYAFVETGPN